MQPGDTISPENSQNNGLNDIPQYQPTTSQPAAPEEPVDLPQNIQQSNSFDSTVPESVAQTSSPSITWTASEFIDHRKNSGWYAVLALSGGILTAIVYITTRDIVTGVAIIIATISFGIFASRKPRTLNYGMGVDGLNIGNKNYSFSNFKSFSIKRDGAIGSIDLMPLQRFMPGLTIYCPPDLEDQIIDVLTSYLPHEERSSDLVDKFMNKIRF